VHCIVQKSRPSTNLGVIASGRAPQNCGDRLRRWENQRRLSSSYFSEKRVNPLVVCRVVSSEIFRKFILMFLEISGNLLIIHVDQLFLSPALQSDAVK